MKLKKFIAIFILFTIAFLNINPKLSFANKHISSNIRIGLFFNSTAINSLTLSSKDGFWVEYKESDNSGDFAEISDTNICVRLINRNNFVSIEDGFKTWQEAQNYVNMNRLNDVYLFYNKSWEVLKAADNIKNTNSPDSVIIKGSSNSGLICPFDIDDMVYFTSKNKDGLITFNNKCYRGSIVIKPSNCGKMTVINELDIEQYLYGVMPKEMPTSWSLEALKAQAVSARTYAVSNFSKWEKYGFDLTDDTRDQVYGGYNVENLRTNRAVDETCGEILLYDGKPITALYHSDSGGITEDNNEVFGTDIPYLKPVKEKYETTSPNRFWKKRYSIDDINRRAQAVVNEIGTIHDISILERSKSGRASKILFSGDRGEKVLSGGNVRNILGLKSTLFDINKKTEGKSLQEVVYVKTSYTIDEIKNLNGKYIISKNGIFENTNDNIVLENLLKIRDFNSSKQRLRTNRDEFVFIGRGWGHGVGMSQWGAKAMADNGHDYVDILQHYYQGVKIR